MRRWLAPLAVAVLAAGLVAGLAAAGDPSTNNKTFEYAIGLWGDLPYSDAQAQTGVPNLIADMNSQDIQFSVHDGDLKAGSATAGSVTPTTCGDALYVQALRYFNSLREPAFFTTGDNDWTDCDRASNGSYYALERLQHERQVLFSGPYADSSMGQKQMKVEVESTPLCLGSTSSTNPGPTFQTPCVENRRWEVHDVMYATFNVQGTCNNLCSSGSKTDPSTGDANGDPAEWAARNAADIAWLDGTFAEATAHGDAAVMLISQADPGFDTTGGQGEPKRNPATLAETDGNTDGFQSWLLAVRRDTIAFGKPVAYVHGDSHYFRIDKPLHDANGLRVENFTRVETFGDNQGNGTQDVNWLKVLVDPQSRDVFAFQPQIVPANQVPNTP
jgi:hypothetical protein